MANPWQRYKKFHNRPDFTVYRQQGGYRAWLDKNPPRQSSWAGIAGCAGAILLLVVLPVCGIIAYGAAQAATRQQAQSVIVPTLASIDLTEEATAEATDETTAELTAEATAEATDETFPTATLTPLPLITRVNGATPTLTPLPLSTAAGTRTSLLDRIMGGGNWTPQPTSTTRPVQPPPPIVETPQGGGSGWQPSGEQPRPEVIIQTVIVEQPPLVQTVIVIPTNLPFPTVDITQALTAIPPSATPTDPASPTPEATQACLIPIWTPEVEITPESTVEPAPESILDATPTPEPCTPTPTATETSPGELPSATSTDLPSSTPLPTATLMPTEPPSATPTATNTELPTATLMPTEPPPELTEAV